MNDFGDGGKTVSCAGGIGNNIKISVVVIVIDSVNEKWSIIFWGG